MSTDKSAWGRFKENIGDTRPWDLIHPSLRAPSDVQDQRFEICKGCPEFIKLTTQCKKCGCIMKMKTHILPAECPIKKW